ncbi:MAG: M23 family metallopeptidase [Acidobacteria bacterium]|jgi:murein DD-endopeptidase MepM/ murein hydrolase activator NlpD|nr:MAG: M23 family metallopeptidase [Acidobacteriota bacterium]
MKKVFSILLLTGALCKPIVDTAPLGIGGFSETSPGAQQEHFDVFDVEKVDRIIATELSVEEAMKELLNVKTPEMVKPDIWPVVGVVTSDYGWRQMGRRSEFHTGIDISAPYGTPVSVVSDGRVIYAGWIRGYGKTVIVYHGYGFATLYSHLSDIDVNYSDRVVKGQIIGKVGTTGRAFGPHLHYEVLKYGIRQNPIAYLP